MKFYYILSAISQKDYMFFMDSISDIQNKWDINDLIKDKYYRVDVRTENTTYNSLILEAWMFIKKVWEDYDIPPNKINWVYKNNMVILNEDLWLFDKQWIKISEKNTYFCTSRNSFTNPFWVLWDKVSVINENFPRLIYPNKDLKNLKQEKTAHITNIYELRSELIWNFMLPLMYSRNTYSIQQLFKLWLDVTGEKFMLLKKSSHTDNGKHITLVDTEKYVWDDQMLEYMFLKYISKISEFDPDLYFVDFYDIKEETRLYYTFESNSYDLHSVKKKKNHNTKDEMSKMATMTTWRNMKVSWSVHDKKGVTKKMNETANYILKANNIEVWVIEFVELPNGEYRFLEINCLGWSMMFRWQDEEDITWMILSWWWEMFKKYI